MKRCPPWSPRKMHRMLGGLRLLDPCSSPRVSRALNGRTRGQTKSCGGRSSRRLDLTTTADCPDDAVTTIAVTTVSTPAVATGTTWWGCPQKLPHPANGPGDVSHTNEEPQSSIPCSDELRESRAVAPKASATTNNKQMPKPAITARQLPSTPEQ